MHPPGSAPRASSAVRHGAVAALTALAMGLFALGLPRLGSMAGALGLAPALLAGRLLGLRGGLVWSLGLCVLMNAILLALGNPFWPLADLALGSATVLMSGGGMGRLQDLRLEMARTERGRVLAETRARVATSERLASLGTLAASIAHEINNPMSYVLSNLEFAEASLRDGGGDPKELHTAIAEARQGAERVRTIAADMRALSRGSAEALAPVDLTATIKSALNLSAPAMKRSVTLQLDLAPVPQVLATESRLGQVVLNLVLNASQAMPARLSSHNRVLVASRTDEQGRAVVEVTDNGTGIPPDVAPHIFDPFFTTKPSGVGTGLGLAICHSIVTSLGGELSFVTAVGQGTTFRVVLPPAP